MAQNPAAGCYVPRICTEKETRRPPRVRFRRGKKPKGGEAAVRAWLAAS
jgi:hypothetical protein